MDVSADPVYAVSTSFSWSNIPTEALLVELSRRDDGQSRPECGSGRRGSYDTAIHVFALFLILVLSCLGAWPSTSAIQLAMELESVSLHG